ncbi:GH11007 [Drosophila grimshawi]|uniref:GH11007 n=1 Tax=Drosophila grimshawi TaxID=7222 RepID=B4JBS7_DROGR|nr:GH11007 [Drosophila grimshawi]
MCGYGCGGYGYWGSCGPSYGCGPWGVCGGCGPCACGPKGNGPAGPSCWPFGLYTC